MSKQITRRGFMQAAAAAATLAFFPTTPTADPAQLPPYPDPARTALIDHWLGQFGRALVSLEAFWSYLAETRALSPAEVNSLQLVELEAAVVDAMSDLGMALETVEFEDALGAITGRWLTAVYIEKYLGEGEGTQDEWLCEVEAIRRDNPTGADEVQALVEAHFGPGGPR